MSGSLLEDQQRYLAFLADASKALSESLDHEQTLKNLVRLTVPSVADWCKVLLVDGDQVKWGYTGAADPERDRMHKEVLARWPKIPEKSSYAIVMRTREPRLIEEVQPGDVHNYATDPEHLEKLRQFGTRSLMVVPLIVRGQLVGAMGLGQAESGRRFTATDVPVLADLGTRAALAVENARLFSAEKAARADAERSLQAWRAGEARFRAILDNSPASIFVKDRDDRYVLVNHGFERSFKVRMQDILGKRLEEVLPDEVATRLQEGNHLVRSGLSTQSEVTVDQGEGLKTYFAVKFPLFDGQGVLDGYCGIVSDVSERKNTEEQLRQSEERFSKVFHGSPVAITISRLSDGQFLDVNERTSELLGYSRDEMVGKTDIELNLWLHEEDRRRAFAIATRKVREPAHESTMRDREGNLRDVLMSLDHITIDGEECALALTLDISERKRLETDLSHSQKMEAIGRLAGGVAHDFNNLLTAMSGYCDLLVQNLPVESVLRESAENIHRLAARAAVLTRQLLVFGRRQVIRESVIDLNAVIREMEPMLRRVIGEDITLEAHLDPNLASIRADPAQLEVAFLNLVLNARDAMPRGGRLTIETNNLSAVDEEARIGLVVRDTGFGMDKRTRSHLFEPFFTTKEVGKGTGLGLSTVYSVVKQAGGHIEVVSEPGKGATFSISLPVVVGASKMSRPRDSIPQPELGSETILLVEDDEDVRDYVGLVLARAGYTVLVAQDGGAAVEIAQNHPGPIHLLLCDVVMPQLNGREVVERLLPLRPDIRVLHVSGYPGETISRYGVIPPGIAFLQKPFTAEPLMRKVREVLESEAIAIQY